MTEATNALEALERQVKHLRGQISDVQEMLDWIRGDAEPAEEIEGTAVRAGVERSQAHVTVGYLVSERGQFAYHLREAKENLIAQRRYMLRLLDAAAEAQRARS